MAGKRKQHSATFKAQVALAAVKGDRTVNELASHYGVHPTLIHAWKKQLLAGAGAVFASGALAPGPPEDRTAELYEQIGRLKVELDRVKKTTAANPAGGQRRLLEISHMAGRSPRPACLGSEVLQPRFAGLEKKSCRPRLRPSGA